MSDRDVATIPLFEKLRALKELSEDEFRDEVVRPLFIRKGLRHGAELCGPDEAGKDCFFYSTDDLGFEMIYVVQTKKGNLNMGKAPKLNVQEAITQLRTAMNTLITDAARKIQTRANVGILCVSGKINEAAKRQIYDEVNEQNLRFIDANDIIPDMDKHYPEYWQGIGADQFPYLNALHEQLISATDVISLANILSDTEAVPVVTEAGFAKIRLSRTHFVPVKHKGKIELQPKFEDVTVNSLIDKPFDRVLIKGEPGSGKSTALRRG